MSFIEIRERELEKTIVRLNGEGYTVYASKLNGRNITLFYQEDQEMEFMPRRSLTLEFPKDDILNTHKTKRTAWEKFFSFLIHRR